MPTACRYTGQRWDEVIQLGDDKARYDDPAIGRFTQPEPGNPQSLNRCAYVSDDPQGRTPEQQHLTNDRKCTGQRRARFRVQGLGKGRGRRP